MLSKLPHYHVSTYTKEKCQICFTLELIGRSDTNDFTGNRVQAQVTVNLPLDISCEVTVN